MSHYVKNAGAQRKNERAQQPKPDNLMSTQQDSSGAARLEKVEKVHKSESMGTFARIVLYTAFVLGALFLIGNVMAEDARPITDTEVEADTGVPWTDGLAEASVEPGDTPEPEDTTSFFDKVGAWFEDKEEAAKAVDQREAGLDAREAQLAALAEDLAGREEALLSANSAMEGDANALKAKAESLKKCVIDAVTGL